MRGRADRAPDAVRPGAAARERDLHEARTGRRGCMPRPARPSRGLRGTSPGGGKLGRLGRGAGRDGPWATRGRSGPSPTECRVRDRPARRGVAGASGSRPGRRVRCSGRSRMWGPKCISMAAGAWGADVGCGRPGGFFGSGWTPPRAAVQARGGRGPARHGPRPVGSQPRTRTVDARRARGSDWSPPSRRRAGCPLVGLIAPGLGGRVRGRAWSSRSPKPRSRCGGRRPPPRGRCGSRRSDGRTPGHGTRWRKGCRSRAPGPGWARAPGVERGGGSAERSSPWPGSPGRPIGSRCGRPSGGGPIGRRAYRTDGRRRLSGR